MHCLDEVTISCPYCGELVSVLVDCSIDNQTYIEDCEVCCRPMTLVVETDDAGITRLEVKDENQVA